MGKEDNFFEEIVAAIFSGFLGGACLYMTFEYGVHFYTVGILFLLLTFSVLKSICVMIINKLKNSSMDNILARATKIAIVFCVLVSAASLAYYFAYKPYYKESMTKKCHKWVSDQTKNSYGNINEKSYNTKFEQCLNEYGL